MGKRKQIETEPLFDLEQWPVPLVLPAGLSDRRRQTAEKLQRIALGLHPLNGLPLDPLAPKDGDRLKRGDRPHTCGACVHLYQIPEIQRSALACDIATTQRPARRWWPGCDQFRPRNGANDGASNDDPAASQ